MNLSQSHALHNIGVSGEPTLILVFNSVGDVFDVDS